MMHKNQSSPYVKTFSLYNKKAALSARHETPKIQPGKRFPEYGTAYHEPFTDAMAISPEKHLYQKIVVYGSGYVLNLLGSRGWCNYTLLPLNDSASRKGRHQVMYRDSRSELQTRQFTSISSAISFITMTTGYVPGLMELTQNHVGLLVVITLETI